MSLVKHIKSLSTIIVSENNLLCLVLALFYLQADQGLQKVDFYNDGNMEKDSPSVCPSADILGSVHSPALRCDHNEVSERLEDIAGTKHVRRRNGV